VVRTDKNVPCMRVLLVELLLLYLLFSSEFLCSHLLYKVQRLNCMKLEIILFSVWVCNLDPHIMGRIQI
jgi:hypothetical protein